jgi:serine/threonine protein kinase
MATDDPTKKVYDPTEKVYDPTETIRIGVFKQAINDLREIDVMPADLDIVKQEFEKAGYQIIENVPTERTSTLGALASGFTEGISYNTISEIFGGIGGDEVQKETEKQMTMEARERPAAKMLGELAGGVSSAALGSIAGGALGGAIGGPPGAVIGAVLGGGSTKLGPWAARGIGALTGATGGAVSAIAAKPMGEKDKLSAGDIATTVLGALLGAGSQHKVYRATDKEGQEFAAKVGDFKNTLGKTESLAKGASEYSRILKEAKIVEDINKLKESKLLSKDTLDTLPDMLLVHDPEKKVAYLKSKILEPLAKKEEEFLRTMPQNIEPNTDLDAVLNKIPNTPEYKRIKDYVLSLKELQEVSNTLGSLKPDNIMVDPQLNKLVIVDIGDIELKPINEIEKILKRPSALEALEEFEIPGTAATKTPEPLSSFAKMKGIEGEERILPAPEEKTAYGLLEKLGYRPIVGEKENVKLNDALQVISENNTIITSQIPRGRGAFGGVFEVAPKSAGDVIKPEDIKVAKLFREPNKKAVRKEIEVRKAIEDIRKDEKTPQIVKDSFVKSEAVEIDGVPIVIQEKLEKLPNNIRKQIDGSFWSQHKFYLRDKEKYPQEIDRKMKKLSPEVKQLLESLEYARLYHGLEWNDIKSANVMWDPKKKIPVIVDSGNFRQKIKPRSLGAAAAESPQQIEDATQVALAHFNKLKTEQPLSTLPKEKQIEEISQIPVYPANREVQQVSDVVLGQLGLRPLLQKGDVFTGNAYIDALTASKGKGSTADVYGALLPKKQISDTPDVGVEEIKRLFDDFETKDIEQAINQRFSPQEIKKMRDGFLLDTEEYVVKLHTPTKDEYLLETQLGELNARNAMEQARVSGKLSPETMEHIPPAKEITYIDQNTGNPFSAFIMPKMEKISDDLKTEINLKFPSNSGPDEYGQDVYIKDRTPENIASMSPDLQELYRALVDLKDKFGLHWYDVHFENIMRDPITKKLVVVDIGDFKYFPIKQE